MEDIPSQVKTRRQLQAEQTKDKLFEAAVSLLAEKDFEQITILDIVAKAHVSIGTFYNYYSTKMEVFYETYRVADHYFSEVVAPALTQGTVYERILAFFDYYARKGFVVVSIDYRLGMKRARQAGLLDEEHFTQALDMTLSMATEDLYDATAYICRHMPDVDPSRIVTCGSSAGAITVLMGEYWLCNGHPLTAGKFTQNFSYAGVIAFAGAVCDTQDSLRWARDPAPMLLFHGDADRNVPYGAIGVDGVWLFGSKSIADDLARRRVPHAFYSVAETNHSMAWRPMTENRGEIDSFLEKLVFKRQRLVTDVRITPLDAPAVPKDFGISDYIDANYGH